jgi:hypothetical protein
MGPQFGKIWQMPMSARSYRLAIDQEKQSFAAQAYVGGASDHLELAGWSMPKEKEKSFRSKVRPFPQCVRFVAKKLHPDGL